MDGDTLSPREAYAAMYAFLEERYRRTGDDELGAMLGGMSLLDDGGTADPAAWDDWLRAVAKAKRDGDPGAELRLDP